MLDLPDHWVWDFWLTHDGGRFHIFFLKAPRNLAHPDRRHHSASVGHAVSSDLTTWTPVSDALSSQIRPAYDDLAVWTGSVVADPTGGWRMFTTGISVAEHGLVQRIGVSWSPDLLRWRRDPRPLLEADPRWYATRETGQPTTHWRDPWVFHAGDNWHMLATAKSATTQTAVVAHAVSPDLVTWNVRPPITRPSRRFSWAEVVSVTTVQGRWALTFSCMSHEMPNDAPGSGGVWSLPVPETAFLDPDGGPEMMLDLDRAVRLTSEELYAGKPVPLGDGDACFLAFRHHDERRAFVGGLIDPIGLGWLPDGSGLRLDHESPPPRPRETHPASHET
jgi:beta-fructofuranosidase